MSRRAPAPAGWQGLLRRAGLGLALALVMGASAAASSEGTLRPGGGQGQAQCIDTGSGGAVSAVCGRLTLHWKLGTLVGEPVSHYGLAWTLESVRVRVGDAVRGFPLAVLPAPLVAAARRSELSVRGLASFVGSGGQVYALDVDTGAAVRSGGELSFNVPGSPNWSRFVVSGGSMLNRHGDRLMGVEGWCDRDKRLHLDAASAKAELRRGIGLRTLTLCDGSLATASALETALFKHCEAEAPGPWCGPRAALVHGDALDQVADAPAVRRVHEQMVAQHRREAQAACSKELAPVQACQRQRCAEPGGPGEAQCRAIPGRPREALGPLLTVARKGPCDAECQSERREAAQDRERERRAFEQRVQAWQAEWGDLLQRCQAGAQARVAHAQCLQASQGPCNPAGLSAESCLERRMQQAPGLEQARALFQRQTQQQAQQRAQGSQAPRFLD